MGKVGLNLKVSEAIIVGVLSVLAALLVNKYMYCFEGLGGDLLTDSFNALYLMPKAFALAPFAFSTTPMGLLLTFAAPTLIWVAVLSYATRRHNYMYGYEHGSSRWASPKEAERFADMNNPDNNVPLSNTEKIALVLPEGFNRKYEKNANICVVGGSGSGKTRYVIKPALLQLNSSYVLTDPKGTLPPETGRLFEENGYKIRIFDTIDFKRSMHYNPLAYIRSEKDILKFVTVLMDNTTGKGEQSGEDFWIKAERLLYNALVGYMFYFVDPQERNIKTLLRLLNMAQASEENENFQSPLDCLFHTIETGEKYDMEEHKWKPTDTAGLPDNFAVMQYAKFKSAAGKTLKSIIVSCAARLGPFDIQELQEMMAYDELELDKIGDEKTILYCCMSDTDSTFDFLSAMLFSQIFNVLCEKADTQGHPVLDEFGMPEVEIEEYPDGTIIRTEKREGGRLAVPVQFLFDEFANIGSIPDFQRTISTIRSRGISAVIILQSKSQLTETYKDAAGIIIDCCDTFLFLGGKSTETNEEIAKMLGQATVDMRNATINRGSQGSYSIADSAHGRDLFQPAEIGRMEKDECIVLIQGSQPFLSKKFVLEQHPRYHFFEGKRFSPEAYVKRQAKIREAELARERALKAERYKVETYAKRRAADIRAAQELSRKINEGTSHTEFVSAG